MEGVIFMGLQASGKSSFYLARFYHTHLRLNLDMLKTRHREKRLFEACLEAKQSLVIDNTNPTPADRARYIPALGAAGFAVVGYYFRSSLAECLGRNAQRQGKTRILEVGVRATHGKLVRPRYAEGFDRLYYVVAKDGQFQVKEWRDEIL
ncbi:MAG: AAA family ATPase [Candidatus Competibacterales bacterium]